MIDDVLVVDATVHAFNFGFENFRQPFMKEMIHGLHWMGFTQIQPQGDPRYWMSLDQFHGLFKLQPRLMQEVLFAESQTDIACYHGVPLYGLFEDGSSPIWVAERIRDELPHRMFIYGDVNPWAPNQLARIDMLADDHRVIGLKFYPLDYYEGGIRALDFTDEKLIFPLLERAQAKGIKTIAIHKAVPIGPFPRHLYDVADMLPAVEAFPALTFEIVHGGFAFAERTAGMLARYPNVTVNLETNPVMSLNMADKFADMMAPLLATGAHDRLFFATGATGMHPRPFIESFWRFEMPKGYPKLTEAMKAGILGANFARHHGWDVEALKAACRVDRYGLEDKQLAEPWRLVREAERAAA